MYVCMHACMHACYIYYIYCNIYIIIYIIIYIYSHLWKNAKISQEKLQRQHSWTQVSYAVFCSDGPLRSWQVTLCRLAKLSSEMLRGSACKICKSHQLSMFDMFKYWVWYVELTLISSGQFVPMLRRPMDELLGNTGYIYRYDMIVNVANICGG